jgi:hypothetical protein
MADRKGECSNRAGWRVQLDNTHLNIRVYICIFMEDEMRETSSTTIRMSEMLTKF